MIAAHNAPAFATRSRAARTVNCSQRVLPRFSRRAATQLHIRASIAVDAQAPGDEFYKPDATLPLPKLNDTYLTPKAARELSSVLAQTPERPALVDIYRPTAAAPAQGRQGAIIFGHAFVQPSYSYVSVIQKLTQAGWLVVAPATDLFDVIGRNVGLTFDNVKRADVKLQSTLQSALIIDMLRAHQMLLDEGQAKDIVFAGHSLGGACSILAAAKVQADTIRGVTLMSPEVREMQKTPVNDDIWLLNGDEESVKSAMTFFADEFPRDTPLALISSRRDNIATPADIRRLFVVATESRQGEDVALFSVDGNHFGYESQLDLPRRINFDGASIKLPIIGTELGLGALDGPLRLLVNAVNATIVTGLEWVQYKAYWLAPLVGNSARQEPQTLEVLNVALQHMFSRESLAGAAVSDAAIGVELQPSRQDVERVIKNEPRDNTTPTPWLDTLLASYSGVQLLNAVTALNLLLQSDGDFETRLGLVILAGLSTNLAYDNALLALGRRIGSIQPNGMRLLQELSKWRFLAHSGAPLMVIAGMNMAGRAGVEWANNPAYEGLVGLAILLLVTISSIRNSLFLEITPRYNRGVLRFSYNDGASPDFTRVVPVFVSTAALILLGWQAWQRDSSLLPLFGGPLLAFLLNAVPSAKDGEVTSKKLPQFVLGNGGEVVLFVSLVLSEMLLAMQGK